MMHWIETYIYVGLAVFLIGVLFGSRPETAASGDSKAGLVGAWLGLIFVITLCWPLAVASAIFQIYRYIAFRIFLWRFNRAK